MADRLASAEGLTERENTFDSAPSCRSSRVPPQQGALASEVRAQAQRFTERADVIATKHGEITTVGAPALRAGG